MRKKKARLWGVERLPKELFPLIEITGQPDIGKKLISSLVANKLHGHCIHFPTLKAESFTGRALLFSLAKQADALEKNVEWWAHIYAANLYESKYNIEGLRRDGPVIVLNYTTAFRTWSKAAGFSSREKLKNFTAGLEEPSVIYSLHGDHWEAPGNFPNRFSSALLSRISLSMRMLGDKRVKIASYDEDVKFRHLQINEAASTIANDIASRYNLPIDDNKEYSMNSLPLKKDGR